MGPMGDPVNGGWIEWLQMQEMWTIGGLQKLQGIVIDKKIWWKRAKGLKDLLKININV